jgi:hypothetical protein
VILPPLVYCSVEYGKTVFCLQGEAVLVDPEIPWRVFHPCIIQA